MANVDNPHGLTPLCRTTDGGEVRVEEYTKDSSGGNIFIHDVVTRETDGNITATGTTPGTTVWEGVTLNYSATGVAGTHLVIINPNAQYVAQDNNDSEGFVTADQGLNANIELNAGSSTSFISGHEIDESTWNTTNTLDVKLHGLWPNPNNAYGPNADIIVSINKSRFGNATTGA